jgi:hypothetical protein
MVFSCVHLAEGATVALVIRARDDKRGEDWQVLCDEQHADLAPGAIRVVHLSHLVRAAPSLRQLSDLSLDEQAFRKHPWDPWERSSLDPEPEQQKTVRQPSRSWWQHQRVKRGKR